MMNNNHIFCGFKDIEEIKFTKVDNDIFSITIKSNIERNNKILNDCTFEAGLCHIDPGLSLTTDREYMHVKLYEHPVIKAECYSIPFEVKLLMNSQLNEIFKIISKSKFD